MSALVRLMEKITGRPHQHKNADMVGDATAKLLATTDNFSKKLRPYSEAADPLSMLFEDIQNQKRGGSGNAGTKFFS